MKRSAPLAICATATLGLTAAGAAPSADAGRPEPPPAYVPLPRAPSALSPSPRPLVPVTPAPSATFTKPAERDDFNGDGYGDLVLRAFNQGSGPERSFTEVLYGGPGGPAPRSHQSIGPTTPGMPPDAHVGPFTSADFDRDGYADLAISVTGYPESTSVIAIFYGSATGLGGRSTMLKTPGNGHDELAAGDFDGRGVPDLVAVGNGKCRLFRNISTKPVTGTNVYVAGRRNKSKGPLPAMVPSRYAWARGPAVADVNGDHRADLVLVAETPAADFEEGESFWSLEVRLGTAGGLSTDAVVFGEEQITQRWSLTAADIDGDGRADVTIPGRDGGTVITFRGTSRGLGPGKRTKLPSENGELHVSAAGDTDGDGSADLALNVGSGITILPGGGNGLVPSRVRRFDRTTPGLPAAPGNALRWFGDGTFLGDLNGDGKADLVIEAPQENQPAQDRVFVLPGSDSGITLEGASTFRAADLK
ncbi:FG-GAP-like repeat-containing protein [Spirillospora sp. NBC_00431]